MPRVLTLPNPRFSSIDALRGVAMLWMTAFHFCFDLNFFGWWRQDFLGDPFWTLQRSAIVSLFLFCAGLGQAVAHDQGVAWPHFWRRWAQLVFCAALVSLASWWLFPRSFIYFGVLHAMALMLLIARITAGWSLWLWPLGLLAVLAPIAGNMLLSGAFNQWAAAFDARTLNWLGLTTHKPFTQDYVPLLPWLGVLWWGLAAGQCLLQHKRLWLARPLPGAATPLVVLGRWSLSYYMLHQPLMLGVMAGVAWWLGRS